MVPSLVVFLEGDGTRDGYRVVVVSRAFST